MTWLRLVRAELRKITTTRMPWIFLALLLAISSATAVAVLFGTDADGTKGFIATAEDQRSLLAFGANAMMIGGLFGAIAAAREYSYETIVPTFLTVPRRTTAMLAQYVGILLAGALLGLVGGALTVTAGLITVPSVEGQEWLLPAGAVAQVVAASALGGAMGAVLGAGVGAAVRNTGGAVAAAVLVLIILPPVLVQLTSSAVEWVPNTLLNLISGVGDGPGLPAALAAIAAWALVPAAVGLVVVQRRDVI